MAKLTFISAAGLACLVGIGAALQAQDRPGATPPEGAIIAQTDPGQAPVVVQAEPAGPGEKLSDKERAATEKELADLQAQRAKLDSRIREVRRKLGRSEWSFAVPNMALRLGEGWGGREMTPEQRAQFEKDMAKAREDMRRATEEMQRALRENLRSLPNMQSFELPAIPPIRGYRAAPPGDSDLRAQIDELRRQLRELRDEIRSQRGSKTDEKSGPV